MPPMPVGKRMLVMLFLTCMLVAPIALTLQTIASPASVVHTTPNPSPFGYTISLSLFIFPALAIFAWFRLHPKLTFPQAAFWLTIAVLAPTGIIMDLLFASSFFTFNNHQAVTGMMIPAVGGDIPIEEIVFYITGFITVLLLYIWCDEFWLEKYNIPDYRHDAQSVDRLLNFNHNSVIFGALLIASAIAYRKLIAEDSTGFPWYFIYLTVIALTPSTGLLDSTRHFINWRALSFTFFVIVLVSLIWEVTLALPYQWWGFQDSAMMGMYIEAWHKLPIEEVVVWFSVSYATIIVYEAIKIWLASGQQLRQFLTGKH